VTEISVDQLASGAFLSDYPVMWFARVLANGHNHSNFRSGEGENLVKNLETFFYNYINRLLVKSINSFYFHQNK
jgi:hypothetical protein